MSNAQIVTRAEQTIAFDGNDALPSLIHQIVCKAARLRAVATHRRPSAPQGRKLARARIANAYGAMAEHLDGHTGSAERRNLCHGQLARRRHALDPQLVSRQTHGPLAMNARLGGQMNLDPRNCRMQRAG